MNNVWTVAFKAPCTGLTTSSLSRCHRQTPIALLSSFAKSITPGRTYSTQPSIVRTPLHVQRTLPLWKISQLRYYASKRDTSATKNKASATPLKTETPTPIPSSLPASEKLFREGIEEAGTVYNDAEPAATVDLSAEQITEIFGHGISFDTGMQILQELQMRRVSGSLQDKGLELPELDAVTETQALAGLEWLRDNFPVDEEAAAKEWTQFEIERLTHAIEDRAERVGLYKKRDNEYEEEAEEPSTSTQPKQVTNVYGDSVLVQRQKELKEKEAAEENAKKEAEEKGAPVESYQGRAVVMAKEQRIDVRREKNKKLAEQYAKAAELSEADILAKRSAFSRLWPSTIFAVAVVAASLTFAESYEPPTSTMRIFPYVSPGMATCMGIALVNMVVFILWKNPSVWKTFNRYMLMSAGHPKALSLFGSIFSHQYPKHIFNNGLILFLVGPIVCDEIGRGNFLALFIISGIGGNVLSLYFHVLTKSFLAASLGMSSALLGVVGAYFTLAKTRQLGPERFGMQYNTWFGLVPLVAAELWMWRKTPKFQAGAEGGGSDYANHVGGIVAGALIGWLLRRRAENEKKEWERFDAGSVVEESATPVTIVEKGVQ